MYKYTLCFYRTKMNSMKNQASTDEVGAIFL